MERFLNTMFEAIPMQDIKSIYLCCQDTRTAIKFLKSCKVPVLGSGRNKYVLAFQFQRALMEIRIHDIKEKYGNDWIELFKEEIKKYYSTYLSIFDEIRKENYKLSEPTAKSEIEQKFLNEIHKTLKVSTHQ